MSDKKITVPISESDIEMFKTLLDGEHEFIWSFGGVEITFVADND